MVGIISNNDNMYFYLFLVEEMIVFCSLLHFTMKILFMTLDLH